MLRRIWHELTEHDKLSLRSRMWHFRRFSYIMRVYECCNVEQYSHGYWRGFVE